MIACIYFFSSLYIILSFNLTSIESTNKIASYIDTVNNIKTYNELQITLNNAERAALTTAIATNDISIIDKRIYEKFNRKIVDIKCTYTIIVKRKLVLLARQLGELRKFRDPNYIAHLALKGLKEEAGFMILTFEIGNYKVAKWFWSYFTKILAIVDYESNKHFLRENLFGEDELQRDIANFLKECKNNGYLSETGAEREMLWTNRIVPSEIFEHLGKSVFVKYYAGAIEKVTIDILYLKPLRDDDELLIFGQITGSEVDWEPTIRRHAVEANNTEQYVINRQWILKPFGHLSYHQLIKRIINARAYIFLWVMLEIFEKEMPGMDNDSFNTVYEQTMIMISTTILDFMAYPDTFFYGIITKYHQTMSGDRNFGNLKAIISARAKESLIELNGSNPNGSDWIRVELNDGIEIMSFLKEFAEKFNRLKAKLGPFNYVLAMSLLGEGK